MKMPYPQAVPQEQAAAAVAELVRKGRVGRGLILWQEPAHAQAEAPEAERWEIPPVVARAAVADFLVPVITAVAEVHRQRQVVTVPPAQQEQPVPQVPQEVLWHRVILFRGYRQAPVAPAQMVVVAAVAAAEAAASKMDLMTLVAAAAAAVPVAAAAAAEPVVLAAAGLLPCFCIIMAPVAMLPIACFLPVQQAQVVQAD